MGKVITLDLSGLEPPEPMIKVLSTLPEVGPEDTLEFTHHREPVPLYAHLEEAGFEHSCEKTPEGRFHIVIRRRP